MAGHVHAGGVPACPLMDSVGGIAPSYHLSPSVFFFFFFAQRFDRGVNHCASGATAAPATAGEGSSTC